MDMNKLQIAVCLLISSSAVAQKISLERAVQTALKNNPGLKAAEHQVDYFREVKKTGSDIGKLSATWMHGQYNSLYQDNNLTLMQSIPFPTTLSNQIRLGREQVLGAQQNLVVQQNNLVYEVRSAYYQLLYQYAVRKLLLSQDSLYSDFARASSVRYQTGESNLLEKTTAETQLLESKNVQSQNEADIRITGAYLQSLIKSEDVVDASDVFAKRSLPVEIDTSLLQNNPMLKLAKQEISINHQFSKVERSRIMPDLIVGGFIQSLTGVQNINGQDVFYSRSKQFTGFELGLSIPLWIKPNIARARAASFQEAAAQKNAEQVKTLLSGRYQQALREFDKNLATISYYESSALKNANLLLAQAFKSFKSGEIGYVEYLQSLKSALTIRNNYLQAIHSYNLSIIKLEYLLGKI
ncbi:hypothetical protein WSM22_15270 [Cytophagales bacterium WSM2-2]|nr:hypothetical protein WSM22_15270 [Cytophagales bacterium WSM2-2]